MIKNTSAYQLFCSLLVICVIFLFTGCADKTSSSPQGELPVVTNAVDNISDIELPSDMKWESDRSMNIKTDSFRGGILNYSGRVEINSLKDFIIASMKKRQWKHVGEASYKNILLAFTKPNKTCMVVLSEEAGPFGNTLATLYVTVDSTANRGGSSFNESTK
jgi:hypothetical protein